jgi:hypothetical protein
MRALIKINLPNFDYNWLKAEMVANGFTPAKALDNEARYTGPDYQFLWNGEYSTDELYKKIAEIFLKRNSSEKSSANGEWTITPLN